MGESSAQYPSPLPYDTPFPSITNKTTQMSGEDAPAVGIDLGTTYSCVGVWKNGKVEIIANEQGYRITPSCVAFNDKERLIGDGAIYQAARNPTNTVFDVKRLVGRRFSDEVVQSDKKLWPFKVVSSGEEDRPAIVVNYLKQEKRFSAEEISSMVLHKMKEIATAFVGRPVKKAVVTVPAYFNNSQRQATKDAATIVGLDVMQILNEPTAAALAYGLDNKERCRGGRKSILVFDLGGGTLDVSLLELDGHGVLEVKATCGDTHLGGQDFDNRMVEFLLKSYREKHSQDPSKDPRAVRKLKEACERAKRVLSTKPVTTVEVDAFYEGKDFSSTFTQAKFVELNTDLFDKCMAPLEQCLMDAGVEKKSVDEVVLVGGSTRIPRVQEMLRSFFEGKELYTSINADEAVAYGASIQAAILNGDKKDPAETPELALLDITPLSLGIQSNLKMMSAVIKKGTRIPRVSERVYATPKDNTTSIIITVLEGERTMGADNNLLGQFYVNGVRPAPAGEVQFKVIFSMDANGILTVTVRNEDNKEKTGMAITRDKFTLRQEEIDRMMREARTYELQDEARRQELLRSG